MFQFYLWKGDEFGWIGGRKWSNLKIKINVVNVNGFKPMLNVTVNDIMGFIHTTHKRKCKTNKLTLPCKTI